MGGPAAPRSYAEYKPRTETLRRARLYGCSTRDPLLRKIRRKKPTPPPIPQKSEPEPVPADLHERLFAYHHPRQEPRPIVGREGHFYAGNAVGGERRVLRELGIKAFTMQHIDAFGIGKVMEMALDQLAGEVARPIHLSYDIDAVDPQHAPSTGTIVRGGLTFREAAYVAEAVGDTGLLTSMDMVEVNPKLSGQKGITATVDMAISLIGSAMGNRII